MRKLNILLISSGIFMLLTSFLNIKTIPLIGAGLILLGFYFHVMDTQEDE